MTIDNVFTGQKSKVKSQKSMVKISASKNGFTILELIITIVIITTLFGAGFLRLLDYRQHQTLNLTKQGIVAVLRNAQNRSLSQESGVPWGVHFENPTGAAANDFYELFSGTIYSPSNVVSRNNLDPEIQFDNPAAGSSKDVLFLWTGRLTAAASITIALVSDSSASSTIIIDTNGAIDY